MRYEISIDGLEVKDHQTGLIWRATEEQGKFTFDEAQAHAEKVANQTGLPWRVPTADEFKTLLINEFPNDMKSTDFWSSTPFSDTDFEDFVMSISLHYGLVHKYSLYRHLPLAVCLVRTTN